MAHHPSPNHSQPTNRLQPGIEIHNLLTPPTTPQLHILPQPVPNHMDGTDDGDNNNNNNDHHSGTVSSQRTSLLSSGSSSSMWSTSTDVRTEDQLFDKIEDIISDYMLESSRHYLQCRVLRWSPDDDLSRVFTAVVVINPPTTRNGHTIDQE